MQKNEGVMLVGLVGPSSAGKTIFSKKVSKFMQSITATSMGNYNDSNQVFDGNYDGDSSQIQFVSLVMILCFMMSIVVKIYWFNEIWWW